jgi:hypothetical protein
LVFLAFRWRALAAAFDAFVAISLRWSSVIVSSRAFPPFLPREGSLAKVAKCASKRAAIRRGSMRRYCALNDLAVVSVMAPISEVELHPSNFEKSRLP